MLLKIIFLIPKQVFD